MDLSVIFLTKKLTKITADLEAIVGSSAKISVETSGKCTVLSHSDIKTTRRSATLGSDKAQEKIL